MKSSRSLVALVVIAVLALVALTPGCTTTGDIVTTELKYTPEGFVLRSPKDVSVDTLIVRKDGTNVGVEMAGYASAANTTALEATVIQSQQWSTLMTALTAQFQSMATLAASAYGARTPAAQPVAPPATNTPAR